jgi:hypothetical protein
MPLAQPQKIYRVKIHRVIKMKKLIAIPSCHSLRDWQDTIRGTWAKDIPSGVDLRFFLGNPKVEPVQEEVFLDVGDSLQELTHKVVAMFRWALENGYDHCFKGDLDTLVRPQALLQSDFRQFDWVGGQNCFFASGGAGYWLSKRAMQIVVEHPIEPGPAEDVNTAHALLEKGIELHNDPLFLFCPGQVMDENTRTYHLSSVKHWGAKASTEDLRKAYEGTFKLPQQEQRLRRFTRCR